MSISKDGGRGSKSNLGTTNRFDSMCVCVCVLYLPSIVSYLRDSLLTYSIYTSQNLLLLLLLLLLLQATERRQQRKSKKGKNSKGDIKQFLGDCAPLSQKTFTTPVEWTVTQESVFQYPCSNGYVANFAANTGLLDAVRTKINEEGRSLGLKNTNCANLCDINNRAYVPSPATGKDSLADTLQNPGLYCNFDNGLLNNSPIANFNKGVNGDENACRCDPPTYLSGCSVCSATITFSLGECLTSPGGNT